MEPSTFCVIKFHDQLLFITILSHNYPTEYPTCVHVMG